MKETVRTFARFCLVGLTGFAANAFVSTALIVSHPPILAWLAGWFCAVCVTWGLNRRYTFRTESAAHASELRDWMFSQAPGGIAGAFGYAALHAFGVWTLPCAIIAACISTLINLQLGSRVLRAQAEQQA
jgi:putative flippase GtrA